MIASSYISGLDTIYIYELQMYSLLLFCLLVLNAITVLITIIVSILLLLPIDFIAAGSLASRIANIDATYPN